jgi:hypothetical protein
MHKIVENAKWRNTKSVFAMYVYILYISFQKQRYHICEVLPLETKQSGGKLLLQSDLWGGVFLEEMSCKSYNKKECKEQKEHHS